MQDKYNQTALFAFSRFKGELDNIVIIKVFLYKL